MSKRNSIKVPNFQSGGVMLRGVQTHQSRKRPNTKTTRQQWQRQMARADW